MLSFDEQIEKFKDGIKDQDLVSKSAWRVLQMSDEEVEKEREVIEENLWYKKIRASLEMDMSESN